MPEIREQSYSGFELVIASAEIIFIEHDYENPFLVGSMLLTILLPLALIFSLKFSAITRLYLGTMAAYFCLYLIYVRNDVAKEGGVPLSGYWIYGAGVLLTLCISIIGAMASARPPEARRGALFASDPSRSSLPRPHQPER